MSASLVQTVASGTTTASGNNMTITVNAGVTTTAGNVVILWTRTASGYYLTGVTDSRGSTWQIDNTGSKTKGNCCMASAVMASGAVLQGGDTITATFTGAPSSIGNAQAGACEFSGLYTTGGTTTVLQTATAESASQTQTVTTSTAAGSSGDLVMTSEALGTANKATFTLTAADSSSGGTWTQLSVPPGTAPVDAGYQISGGSSKYSAAWTATVSSNSNAIITVYKSGTGGGTTAPTVTTGTQGTTTTTSVVISNSTLNTTGGANPTTWGVCYVVGSGQTPTIANSTVSTTGSLTAGSQFSETMSGLAASTTYSVRAYATNTAGTGYGTELDVTTSSSGGGGLTVTNSFESGTDGTAISTSNSGGASGTAWDSLGGSTTLPVYSSAAAMHGSMGASTPLSGNSTTTIEWKAAFSSGFNSSSTPWYGRDYFKFTTLPPAMTFLMKAQDDNVPQDVWGIGLDTGGHLTLRNRISGATLATATTAISANTANRYEFECVYDGSTYSLTVRCFYNSNAEGTTPDETLTGSVSSTDAVDIVAWGAQCPSVQTWSTVYHDDIALSTAGWIGPYSSDSSVNTTNFFRFL